MFTFWSKKKDDEEEFEVTDDEEDIATEEVIEEVTEEVTEEVIEEVIEMDENFMELRKSLVEWRKKKALDKNISAFLILHNKTLDSIAKRRPSTITELFSIKGIGSKKTNEYGREILDIVEYCIEAEYTEEEYTEEEYTEEEMILSDPICQLNSTTTLYKVNVRDLVHIPIWTYQRCLDQSHVDSLVSDFKQPSYTPIGTIKALINKQGELKQIDGQHRIAAYKKIINSDAEWNRDVILEVHKTDNFDSESSVHIFKKANNVKNLNIEDFPSKVASRLIKRCRIEWPNMLKTVAIEKRVNRPKLNSKKLYTLFKQYLMYPSCTLKENDIWKEIIQCNRRMGCYSPHIWKCSKNVMNKARQKGFFLGLDKNFKWVDSIFLTNN